MELDLYNNAEAAKVAIVQAVKDKLSGEVAIEDLAQCIKALEVLEDCQHIPEYAEAVALVSAQTTTHASDLLSGENMMMLARATKLTDIPYGAEDRWKQKNLDEMNVDYAGDIVIGERTLESFDDKVMETFYA